MLNSIVWRGWFKSLFCAQKNHSKYFSLLYTLRFNKFSINTLFVSLLCDPTNTISRVSHVSVLVHLLKMGNFHFQTVSYKMQLQYFLQKCAEYSPPLIIYNQLFIVVLIHFSVKDCNNLLNELIACNKINFWSIQTLITFGVNTLWLDPGKDMYFWKEYSMR